LAVIRNTWVLPVACIPLRVICARRRRVGGHSSVFLFSAMVCGYKLFRLPSRRCDLRRWVRGEVAGSQDAALLSTNVLLVEVGGVRCRLVRVEVGGSLGAVGASWVGRCCLIRPAEVVCRIGSVCELGWFVCGRRRLVGGVARRFVGWGRVRASWVLAEVPLAKGQAYECWVASRGW